MLTKMYRTIFTLVGALCGLGISFIVLAIVRTATSQTLIETPVRAGIMGACIVITALIFFLICPRIRASLDKVAQELDTAVQKLSSQEFIFGTIGLILGLFIAYLISQLWRDLQVPVLGTALSILVYIVLGYLGMHVSSSKSNDLAAGFRSLMGTRNTGTAKSTGRGKRKDAQVPKILDTSVIIDGRIADIVKTGFIEGTIIIPDFVLVELRHIADSSDSLKRNRGRRGLDILNKMQTAFEIEIYDTGAEKSLNNIAEVDLKLLELGKIMKGKVVTNDYNLNKVASIQNVPVLNINELANTLKPVVLPGEEMKLTPVKEGKEQGQAVAYLDDGTMIVVEDGREHIGEEITVLVSSVLQTSAGRMIFARTRAKN